MTNKSNKKVGPDKNKGSNVQSRKFRIISKEKYIISGVIAFLIFALGLTLGLIVEDQRYEWAQQIAQEQELSYLSLQLQYLFLNTFEDKGDCAVLFKTLQDTIDDLSGSLSKVIDYEKEESIDKEEFQFIAKRYTLDNLRYWLLANKAKERCDLDIVTTVYFYSDDCDSCPSQGMILTYFKKLFGDQLLVFPINIDQREKEPMVDLMMSLYDINKYPSIIVEGEKFEGVVKKNLLQDIICENLVYNEDCGDGLMSNSNETTV